MGVVVDKEAPRLVPILSGIVDADARTGRDRTRIHIVILDPEASPPEAHRV